MAKCDLSIVLDDPQGVHLSGGKITGVVKVQIDADVECKGLEVKSGWRTHGRGNVASGTAGTMTLFQGQWRAGETQEYRFELPIADWPPSYHGYYLSVDHYIDVRAKIPWAFDPKASEPFPVVANCEPGDAKIARNVTEIKGIVGVIVTVVILGFVVGFCVMLAAAGPFALFLLIVPVIGSIWWFFRKFLPKYLLGDVRFDFDAEHVSPGGTASGQLVIRPKKNVPVNAISLHFRAREQCVSGSGSNRKTHTHVFLDTQETIQQATTLTAGQEQTFPVHISIPADAAYSMELSDNKVIWSTTLRVDIPRWPDWVREIPLPVLPSGKTGSSKTNPDSTPKSTAPAKGGSESFGTPQAIPVGVMLDDPSFEEPSQTQITFEETANHIWDVREDREQVEMLVDAVSG
ncbi:MAG: sporulation protein, partial [Planctomycetota bacterium]